MRFLRVAVAIAAVSIVAAPLAYSSWLSQRVPAASAAASKALAPALPPAPALEFKELFEPGRTLKPSAKLLSLANQRVRMVGFMADMELPPNGGFYLTARPVHCDEAGGGTADLPPSTVFVVARSAGDRPVPHIQGALEVAGVLEVGNRTDADGRASTLRLHLDGPPRG